MARAVADVTCSPTNVDLMLGAVVGMHRTIWRSETSVDRLQDTQVHPRLVFVDSELPGLSGTLC